MRNSQKRLLGEFITYFITTNTQDKFPFFKEHIFCELFVETLRLCKKLKEFELYAFAILHEHVHLLLYPLGEYDISDIMHAIKRHFSRNANLIIDKNNLIFPEGEVCKPRLHLDAHEFNENIIKYRERFIQKYPTNYHLFPSFQWQQSFHDRIIRGDRDFQFHYDYINFNCEKHHICSNAEKYQWSSLNSEFEDLIDVCY